METPECKFWNLWLGKEVEGFSNLGEMTLFVRSYPPRFSLDRVCEDARLQPVRRIWFCEEFIDAATNTDFIAEAYDLGFTCVCVCVRYPLFPSTQWIVRDLKKSSNWVHIYVKISDLNFLTASDHVCIGGAYADESFRIGDGKKVSPADYRNDIFIA